MQESLLDTDMLNEVLKQRNPLVVRRAADYLVLHQQFAISTISWYEVFRGLMERNATTQLTQFHTFCSNTVQLPVTNAVLERAAALWVAGRSRGLAPKDADLFIAATALVGGRALVTGNTPHFAWIPGLTLDNWRNP